MYDRRRGLAANLGLNRPDGLENALKPSFIGEVSPVELSKEKEQLEFGYKNTKRKFKCQ